MPLSSSFSVRGLKKKDREKDVRLYVPNRLLHQPYGDCVCLLSINVSIAVRGGSCSSKASQLVWYRWGVMYDCFCKAITLRLPDGFGLGDTTSTLDLDFFTLRGSHLSVSVLVRPTSPFHVDGQPYWPRSHFQQNNPEIRRGNSAACLLLHLPRWTAKKIDWQPVVYMRRGKGANESQENDLCPSLSHFPHAGLHGCCDACLYTYCWENDIQSRKGQYE